LNRNDGKMVTYQNAVKSSRTLKQVQLYTNKNNTQNVYHCRNQENVSFYKETIIWKKNNIKQKNQVKQAQKLQKNR